MQRIGVALTGLVVLFLLFDGTTKIIRVPPVIEACRKMGLEPNQTVAIGGILLGCTLLYALPRTAVLGALLLTGYLGGAMAAHLVARSGTIPTTFALGFGVLAWTALVLREPSLLEWLLRRPSR